MQISSDLCWSSSPQIRYWKKAWSWDCQWVCRGDGRCRHFPLAKQDPCHKRRQSGTGQLCSTQSANSVTHRAGLRYCTPKQHLCRQDGAGPPCSTPKCHFLPAAATSPPPLTGQVLPLPAAYVMGKLRYGPCPGEGSSQAAPSASKWGEDSVKPHSWAVQGESLSATGQPWHVPTGLGIGMGWEM